MANKKLLIKYSTYYKQKLLFSSAYYILKDESETSY